MPARTRNKMPALNGSRERGLIETWNEMPRDLRGLIKNELTLRQALMERELDTRRDIDEECNFPNFITPTMYRDMFDRDGVAKRAVSIEPDESWKLMPEIYEDENSDNETQFEKLLDELFVDAEKATIHLWSYLHRIDILSGVGHYGVLLLGLDDLKPNQTLEQPVANVNEDGTWKKPSQRRLLFMRAFDESVAAVSEWNTDITSPRYGLPEMYNLTFLSTNVLEQGRTPGMASAGNVSPTNPTQQKVHWSRVLHFADNRLTNEVAGVPRQQDIFNYLLNVKKILGSNGEGFWQMSFGGISFETLPGLEDVDIDFEGLKDQLQMYFNKMQKYLALSGMTAKSLAPTIVDPSNHFTTQAQAIALSKGIPYRIFLGSEEAKLASGQDKDSWNERMAGRREKYLSPFVVRPTIQRLIDVGVLPQPKQFMIRWPDIDDPTEDEKAATCQKQTSAMKDYVAAGINELVVPKDYLTTFLGLEDHVAKEIIKNAEKQIADEQSDPTAVPLGTSKAPQPVDPNAPPQPGQPKPKPQQPAQVQNEGPDFFEQWYSKSYPDRKELWSTNGTRVVTLLAAEEQGQEDLVFVHNEMAWNKFQTETIWNYNPNHDQKGKFAKGGGSHWDPLYDPNARKGSGSEAISLLIKDTPITAKELAEQTGQKLARVNTHLQYLRKRGLIIKVGKGWVEAKTGAGGEHKPPDNPPAGDDNKGKKDKAALLMEKRGNLIQHFNSEFKISYSDEFVRVTKPETVEKSLEHMERMKTALEHVAKLPKVKEWMQKNVTQANSVWATPVTSSSARSEMTVENKDILNRSAAGYYRPSTGEIHIAGGQSANTELDIPLVGSGNYLVSGGSYEGIMRHEYGHHVWYKMLDEQTRGKFKQSIAEAVSKRHSSTETKIGFTAKQIAESTHPHHEYGADLLASAYKVKVSVYAATNISELWAESFGAYTHPGYKSGILPKEIESFMDKHLKGEADGGNV
jgi:uncharacterized protein